MTAPLGTPLDGEANSIALDALDVSDPKLYQDDVWYPYFARLRREDPVHYVRESRYGPYWAVTKYKDIMQVEVNHAVYSSASELGGISTRWSFASPASGSTCGAPSITRARFSICWFSAAATSGLQSG